MCEWVRECVVSIFFIEIRRNEPARCSDECVPGALPVTGIKEASRDTEVTKLNAATGIDENVASLDISVDVTVVMKVLQTLEDLPEDGGNYNLLEAIRVCGLQYVKARTSSHERHHHPQVVIAHEGAVRFQHVRVVHQHHCLCLTRYIILHIS